MTATDPSTDRIFIGRLINGKSEGRALNGSSILPLPASHWQDKANDSALKGFHHLAQGLAKLAKSEIARATVAAGVGEVEP